MVIRMLLAGILILGPTCLPAQESIEGRDFPVFPADRISRMKSSVKLPAKVNLAKSKYFPDIFMQYGWSCNQSSSIGYLLTYELNRMRNADGSLPENRYSPFYVWNFLNDTKSTTGVSYFDSWEIIKAGGAPNEADFPNRPDLRFWMSGYDRYHRAMKNRVLKNWSLPVGTPEGLEVLKRYLFDHFDGSKFGGMANFQIASGGMNLGKLPPNSYDEGASFITTFGVYVGHALTIVGYNDSIRLDRNSDGEYTNNLDINNDHVVDLLDFEKGALIVANTWGIDWGDRGFAYLPYHILGRYGRDGGIWNKSVHIVETARTVDPVLTMKVSLSHESRGNIRIMAGISNDPNATAPEHLIEFPMFNFQGAQVPLYDSDAADTTRFELGLDISPLTDFIAGDGPVRIFLAVDERDGWNSFNGKIHSLTVFNDFNGRDTAVSDQWGVEMVNNGRTLVSLVRNVRYNRITIREVPKLFVKPGEIVSVQMESDGAVNPSYWELVPDYRISFGRSELVRREGYLLYNGQIGNPVSRVSLPFNFRFFGQGYDYLIVTEDGMLLFDQEETQYPYVIDPSLVFRSMKKIVGFGSDLDYYMPDNAVTWFANDTMAAVRWEAMAPSAEGSIPVTIVCELYPDGRIRYIYDKPELLFPEGSLADLGVSNGDHLLFRRAGQFNPEGTPGVNTLLIDPYLYPDEIKFDETGWLFCRPGKSNTLYEVKVRIVDKNNRMAWTVVRISTEDLAGVPILSVVSNNPFTTGVTFNVIVPEKSRVIAEIYDLAGRKLALLHDSEMVPAEYRITWNGKSDGGTDVPPGIYICRLIAGERKESLKLMKLE